MHQKRSRVPGASDSSGGRRKWGWLVNKGQGCDRLPSPLPHLLHAGVGSRKRLGRRFDFKKRKHTQDGLVAYYYCLATHMVACFFLGIREWTAHVSLSA